VERPPEGWQEDRYTSTVRRTAIVVAPLKLLELIAKIQPGALLVS
jgi:hypothetical protein